jgi:hypothetical protein
MRWNDFDFLAELDPMAKNSCLVVGLTETSLTSTAVHAASVLAQSTVRQMLRRTSQSLVVDQVDVHRALSLG